jgi:uncharacterized membrane protein YeiH
MTAPDFHVPVLLDYGATLLWSLTGALVAVRRGCDVVGLFVIALTSALGGGLIRDGLFLNVPPPAVTEPYYLPIVAFAVLAVVVFRTRLEPWTRHRVVDYIDAVGMGAFAIVGMQKALGAQLTIWGVVLVGVINAVGGGMLRDVLVGETPAILKPSQFYSLPVLAGCLVFLTLDRLLGVAPALAAWITIVFIFLGRALTIRFNWRTQALMPPNES